MHIVEYTNNLLLLSKYNYSCDTVPYRLLVLGSDVQYGFLCILHIAIIIGKIMIIITIINM